MKKHTSVQAAKSLTTPVLKFLQNLSETTYLQAEKNHAALQTPVKLLCVFNLL